LLELFRYKIIVGLVTLIVSRSLNDPKALAR
jgi:hypothetical protein